MAIYSIDNEKKDIVGVGKMMIDTRHVSWNIPQLHFLVLRLDNHFEAVCLEFGLVASGETSENSAERLIEHTIHHISSVIVDGGGFDEFKDISLNNFMSEYWNAYRHIEFCLAEKKSDLSHEIESRITRALQELFDRKIRELILIRAKNAADEVIKEYEKMSTYNIKSITYTSLETAA